MQGMQEPNQQWNPSIGYLCSGDFFDLILLYNSFSSISKLIFYRQSPFFDGKTPNWHHFECFFKKAKITGTHEIKGYDSLRYDDQQRIKEKFGVNFDQDDTATTSKETGQIDVRFSILNLFSFSVKVILSNFRRTAECTESNRFFGLHVQFQFSLL